MLLRRLARPLFASWFVVEGLDAAMRPAPHVAAAQEALQVTALLPRSLRLQAVRDLDERQLRRLVKWHGVAMAAAGLALAGGRAPRAAGLALAVLTAPTIFLRTPAPDPDSFIARRNRVLRAMSATGGALLAAGDTAGKPGLGWRLRERRQRSGRQVADAEPGSGTR